MNVAHMKLVPTLVTTFAMTLGSMNVTMAAQTNVHLFLDAPTAETSIDAVRASFRSELVDQDLTERHVTERPRVTLSCNDKKTQVLHLNLPSDLNPWPSLKDTLSTEVDVKTIDGFSPYTGSLLAMPLGKGLDISLSVGDKAAGIGRAWYEGMPIFLTIPSGGTLPDVDVTLFGAEPTRHFRSELASAIKVCEIFSS